jgi:hypothetical protein
MWIRMAWEGQGDARRSREVGSDIAEWILEWNSFSLLS